MTPLGIFRFFLSTLILTTFLLFFPPAIFTSTLASMAAAVSTPTNLLSSPSGSSPTIGSRTLDRLNPARPLLPPTYSEDPWIACDTTDKSPFESAIEATAAKITDGSSCSQRNMGGSKCTTLASHDGAKISICGKYLGLMSCQHVRVVVEAVKVQCSRGWPRRSGGKFVINGVRVVLHSWKWGGEMSSRLVGLITRISCDRLSLNPGALLLYSKSKAFKIWWYLPSSLVVFGVGIIPTVANISPPGYKLPLPLRE